MKRISFLKKLSIVMILIILGGIYFFYAKESHDYINKRIISFGENEKEKVALENFVNEYFIEDGFCRTNLKDSIQGDMASGEDILSESIGLLMLYYLQEDNEAKFKTQVDILIDHFMNAHGLIKWRIRRENKQQIVNASIDDLRIIKALLFGAERWNKNEYRLLAKDLSNRLLQFCVTDDTLKAYDLENSIKAPNVYYDFEAMKLMEQFDKQWYKISKVNIEEIVSKQVEGLPFYKERWNSNKNAYSTVENLMTMMHLSQIGICDKDSITWLKKQLTDTGLYGSYSAEGQPLNSVESPAIYAIVAQIGKINNDEKLYKLAIIRLKSMQNLENNQYYGGFIDLKNRTAFSFDNLFSLLAY